MDLDYARDLPPEPTSADGFKNNGQSLGMSAEQLEYYLQIAREAMEKAGMKCAMQCYDAADKCEKACPASAADGEACRTTCAETGDGCRKSCPGGGGEPTEADPMPD